MSAVRVALPLGIVLVAAGLAPATDADLARFQGRWSTRAGPGKDIPVVLEVRDRTVEATISVRRGFAIRAKGELRLDATARPRALDWVHFVGGDGEEFPEVRAIYRFDGERLVICNAGFNDERPSEFRAGDGVLADVLVFERRGF